MKSQLSKIVLTLGTVLVLGSSASMAADVAVTRLGDAQFKQIHAGLTQDEVRSALGNPATVLANARPGITLWTYNYTDTFGYKTEFDVNIDANGVVTGTDSLRPIN